MGVDVYLGHAKFIDKNKVEVNGQVLTFSKACIASGGKPAVPNLPGIENVHYYNSDTIWNLTKQPKKMVIVGAGPIGSELG